MPGLELPPFELHKPTSLGDALRLARDLEGGFDFVAGGTDLLPNYKYFIYNKPHVIALSGIDSLREISLTRLGAMTTLREIERSPLIREKLSCVSNAASLVAGPLHRNQGTLGGNIHLDTRCYYLNQTRWWRESKGGCLKELTGDICLVTHKKEGCVATYSGDMAAILMVLGGSAEIASLRGIDAWDGDSFSTRLVPLADYFRDDGFKPTILEKGEMLTAIVLPENAPSKNAGYKKLRLRESVDFPIMGVAACVELDGLDIGHLEIVVNAVQSCPLTMSSITGEFIGQELTDKTIARIASDVEKSVTPVKNVFLSVVYRKKMVGVFLRRLLTELREKSGG
ncbi:MAG: FAD binding domain-containing protein [Planctomycetes bacterium]|nr:FAD binding domain-containing protein [Planctomycetota bacterium]